MLLAFNALLYLSAFTVAIAATAPQPGPRPRRERVARFVLLTGGSLSVSAAIGLMLNGMWFESALAGSAAILVVGASMWFGLTRVRTEVVAEEDEDDDGGGSLYGPPAPEPTRPEGGPSEDFWDRTDPAGWAAFDAARAAWEREREPAAT